MLELAVVTLLGMAWLAESSSLLFWIPPERARVAALGVYLGVVILGGAGNRNGDRRGPSWWYWSSVLLAVPLMGMEVIGYLKSTMTSMDEAPELLTMLNNVPIEYPLNGWVRYAMLMGIWLTRGMEKLPQRFESTQPVASADMQRGVWFVGPACGAMILAAVGLFELIEHPEDTKHLSRNFYGVLQVSEDEDDIGVHYSLTHGQIKHGLQYLEEPWRSAATTYYAPGTGVEMALRLHPRRQRSLPDSEADAAPLRVGVIGLGTGSIAATSQEGDHYQFYEINPDVIELSSKGLFTYLRDCPATTEVILGDARVMMEREFKQGGSKKYDVIVVDAFSSDAIPVHLLTQECGDIYKLHLKEDGILAIHITNRYMDLSPIARALADHLNWEPFRFETDYDRKTGVYDTTWVLVTGNQEFADLPEVSQAHVPWDENDRAPILWTDDFASLYQIID